MLVITTALVFSSPMFYFIFAFRSFFPGLLVDFFGYDSGKNYLCFDTLTAVLTHFVHTNPFLNVCFDVPSDSLFHLLQNHLFLLSVEFFIQVFIINRIGDSFLLDLQQFL